MRLLSWMSGVKANSGIRMKNTRRRNPPTSQLAHPRPSEVALPAPMDQHAPPESGHPRAKCRQTVNVSRYCVVVEVTLDDRPKPLAGLRHRFVHPSTQFLLDFQQLGPHPFAHRLALQRIVPVSVLPADMRLSRPMEFHHRPLAEPSVRLSPHSAPIRQTRRPYRFANGRREPTVP